MEKKTDTKKTKEGKNDLLEILLNSCYNNGIESISFDKDDVSYRGLF